MTLSVIGAGFGRTGTLSLKLALEELGFGPCYHMMEVFKNPSAFGWWEAAADGGPVDWARIFEGYRSTVDWPNATFYRELAEAYPEARVILTERDPETWFASTQATIFAREIDPATEDPFERMILKVVYGLFDRRMHDKDHVISVFKAHNARVREVIAPERLLVYEVTQGWAPLCEFLGVPVPDGPMPKVNARENFPRDIGRAAVGS
ncbi:sulfotransferase family protein [Phenylobacterium sp.]|uniref:sulfotransferase family protein n=1 Tax=Phenylobacterium sp. TaxID=1871053 RepID=UPI003983111F